MSTKPSTIFDVLINNKTQIKVIADSHEESFAVAKEIWTDSPLTRREKIHTIKSTPIVSLEDVVNMQRADSLEEDTLLKLLQHVKDDEITPEDAAEAIIETAKT